MEGFPLPASRLLVTCFACSILLRICLWSQWSALSCSDMKRGARCSLLWVWWCSHGWRQGGGAEERSRMEQTGPCEESAECMWRASCDNAQRMCVPESSQDVFFLCLHILMTPLPTGYKVLTVWNCEFFNCLEWVSGDSTVLIISCEICIWKWGFSPSPLNPPYHSLFPVGSTLQWRSSEDGKDWNDVHN